MPVVSSQWQLFEKSYPYTTIGMVSRNDCWWGKGKCVSQFCDQDVRCFLLICVQPLVNCGSDGCIRVDARSVTIQGQQVRLFRGPRQRSFCMNDVAPASLLTDLVSGFFALSNTELLLPRGKGDFMDFYLAGRLPDDEIRYVGVCGSLRGSPSKAFGLTSVLLHG